jgi:hypothetical protein
MMCKFQLVWLMHMRITIVLVKLGFLLCRRFQNGKKKHHLAQDRDQWRALVNMTMNLKRFHKIFIIACVAEQFLAP